MQNRSGANLRLLGIQQNCCIPRGVQSERWLYH